MIMESIIVGIIMLVSALLGIASIGGFTPIKRTKSVTCDDIKSETHHLSHIGQGAFDEPDFIIDLENFEEDYDDFLDIEEALIQKDNNKYLSKYYFDRWDWQRARQPRDKGVKTK